ncbi:hypothetical protein [Lewinella sp. IMCC34191]|uniref:hypothetical protein n=1 Tax=Lewinella sp. IMCC34191 TaxID=2259172 RepID=UPI000E266634|nr:hypothetical protein [Lewinella sp. IMCC34191]
MGLPLKFFACTLFLLVLVLGACSVDRIASVQEEGVCVSYTDSTGYSIFRNGQPYSVRGASGHQRMELLQSYGGNTVRVYDPDSLGIVLDRAQQLGMAVIADLPLPYYHKGGDEAARDLKRIAPNILEIVATHRKHPALLYWILGNELFNKGYSGKFVDAYNALASEIRRLDPLHPISSTFNVHQLAYSKIRWKQPDIDFVSFNLFGNLADLPSDLRTLWLIWRGPYVLTEWGYNGPWEAKVTKWQVPIEPPNAVKSTHLRERFMSYVEPLYEDKRLMGDLAFYWGNKFESTPTWFSYFTPEGHSSEMAHTIGQLLQGQAADFPGPSIEYLLINGNGEGYDHMLAPDTEASAEVRFIKPPDSTATITWELRKEDWQNLGAAPVVGSDVSHRFSSRSTGRAVFRVPRDPGPYRLYYQANSSDGYFTAANLPFYVLSPDDAE